MLTILLYSTLCKMSILFTPLRNKNMEAVASMFLAKYLLSHNSAFSTIENNFPCSALTLTAFHNPFISFKRILTLLSVLRIFYVQKSSGKHKNLLFLSLTNATFLLYTTLCKLSTPFIQNPPKPNLIFLLHKP